MRDRLLSLYTFWDQLTTFLLQLVLSHFELDKVKPFHCFGQLFRTTFRIGPLSSFFRAGLSGFLTIIRTLSIQRLIKLHLDEKVKIPFFHVDNCKIPLNLTPINPSNFVLYNGTFCFDTFSYLTVPNLLISLLIYNPDTNPIIVVAMCQWNLLRCVIHKLSLLVLSVFLFYRCKGLYKDLGRFWLIWLDRVHFPQKRWHFKPVHMLISFAKRLTRMIKLQLQSDFLFYPFIVIWELIFSEVMLRQFDC